MISDFYTNTITNTNTFFTFAFCILTWVLYNDRLGNKWKPDTHPWTSAWPT